MMGSVSQCPHCPLRISFHLTLPFFSDLSLYLFSAERMNSTAQADAARFAWLRRLLVPLLPVLLLSRCGVNALQVEVFNGRTQKWGWRKVEPTTESRTLSTLLKSTEAIRMLMPQQTPNLTAAEVVQLAISTDVVNPTPGKTKLRVDKRPKITPVAKFNKSRRPDASNMEKMKDQEWHPITGDLSQELIDMDFEYRLVEIGGPLFTLFFFLQLFELD